MQAAGMPCCPRAEARRSEMAAMVAGWGNGQPKSPKVVVLMLGAGAGQAKVGEKTCWSVMVRTAATATSLAARVRLP